MGPLEFLYYTGYKLKKSRDLKSRKRLPAKVISVGNITVGGTGKTPAVIAIARKAKEYGYLPCILTRGYRGSAKGPCFVSRGEGPLLGVDEAGDEPVLMAERLTGVPIVKGSDRYEAGMFALDCLDSPSLLFILDDGFQHQALHRDVDVLLIDGMNPFGNGKLLPAGILREPLPEMGRADVVVITRVSRSGSDASEPTFWDRLIDTIRDHNPDALLYMAEHLPVGLMSSSGVERPVTALSGKSVVAFCGIGNPSSFEKTLLRLGAKVKEFLAFRDHFAYGRRDLSRIVAAAERRRADWIVTTEKDIMRLKWFELPENLVSLRIEFTVDDSFYGAIFREG